MPRVSLHALVQPERWQRLQEHLTRVLGIPLRTVSPAHALLSAPTWPAGMEPDTLIATLRLGEELDQLLPADRLPQEIATLVTPLGVSYAAVPIRSAPQEALAYLVVGPMLVGPRENEQRFRRRLATLGQDPAALWPVVLSLRLYSFVSLRSALGLLEDVGGMLVHLASRLSPEGAAATTGGAEAGAAEPRSERVFRALLETAIRITRADGGSLMLYDRSREALRIRAAQGLSPAVVAGAEVKLGEGLAGLAVAQRRTLLVDAHAGEPITSRMQRTHLHVSLVMPLMPDPQGEPVGVLNLRIVDPDRQFQPDHDAMLRSLLDLAFLAL